MENSVALGVGDGYHLATGKDRIIYAGMPSENVYSIVQRRASGYQGYAWNLYFQRSQTDITLDGVRLYVESATADSLRFRKA